jgi:peptidoglycan/LPS O-acetylase OafA/YrhL
MARSGTLQDARSVSVDVNRLVSLDGLRGTAALIVVFHHFCAAYIPSLVPGENAKPLLVADTPLAIFYNGAFSVVIFFVLSGFVIAHSAARKERELPLNLTLRYTRLALPCGASVLSAWMLLKVMPNAATELYSRMPHPWLLWTYQGAIPGVRTALWQGLVLIFFRSGFDTFNNPLWTMKIEFIGSCFLYIFYFVLRGRVRLPVLVILAAFFPIAHKLNYEGFFLGAILRELWAANRLRKVKPTSCFFAGLILGSFSAGFHQRMHLPSVPEIFRIGSRDGILYPLAAALIVYGCITAPRLGAAFSCAPARFLGRISFPLYLFHVPLLYTVFAGAMLRFWPASDLQLAILFLVFVGVAISLGYLGTVTIDEPVLKMNASIRGFLRGRSSARAMQAVATK